MKFDRFKNSWNYSDAVTCQNDETDICRSFLDRIYSTKLSDEDIYNNSKKECCFLGKEEYAVDNYDRDNKIIKFMKRIKKSDSELNIKITKQYRFLKKRIELIYENIQYRIKKL